MSASKGRCEIGVESNISKTGLEHSCTAKIYGFTNFSAGVRVPSKSFKEMLHPLNVVNNGHFFVGCRLKRGPLIGNARSGVLPVEKLKNVVSLGVDETEFRSSSLYFEEQDQVGLSSKEIDQAQHLELVFKQEGVETRFAVADVKTEADEQEEGLEHESRKTTDEGTHVGQGYMVAAPIPAHLVPSNRGLDFFYYGVGKILFLQLILSIWELFSKFKTRDKDL
ncbi:MAG: hypothetical protein ACRDL7_01330 [Gaiellaceae bacterium]